MPELPEVETVVRTLRPRLAGRTIMSASGGFDVTPAIGQVIRDVTRHGKYIALQFDAGMLLVHLRMTGKLLFDGARTPYTRAEFVLDSGVLLYDDIRRFGRITCAFCGAGNYVAIRTCYFYLDDRNRVRNFTRIA